jgi:hypothetical protein
MAPRTCAAAGLALSICGCATPNSPNTPNTAGRPEIPSTCLTSAGSLIPAGSDKHHCTAWGRSYSRTDIDQTGKTTVAGALRDLDPSLTITH